MTYTNHTHHNHIKCSERSRRQVKPRYLRIARLLKVREQDKLLDTCPGRDRGWTQQEHRQHS